MTPPPRTDADGLLSSLGRLARLELELGLAEVRDRVRTAVIAVGVAIVSGIVALASLPLLAAAAFAPLFNAGWEPLLIAGGGALLLAAGAIAWSVTRWRRLDWPRLTLSTFEENWRWLGAQLRSRLTWP